MITGEALEETKEQATDQEKRGVHRTEYDISASCSAYGVRWLCRIVNHSPMGLAIATPIKLQMDSIVHFSELDAQAKVVWSEGNITGLRIIKR
jgi:hypothetical protein